MNCFQKLLSSWWRTTSVSIGAMRGRLWIAFKNYYLRDEGQQDLPNAVLAFCCELLSKIIIFVMKDNGSPVSSLYPTVVNCFQKLLSSWWRTTLLVHRPQPNELWIAFKNYYLRDEGQHSEILMTKKLCCELLSKIIIFVMKDNSHCKSFCFIRVVNCFQKLLSSWWRTTKNFCDN